MGFCETDQGFWSGREIFANGLRFFKRGLQFLEGGREIFANGLRFFGADFSSWKAGVGFRGADVGFLGFPRFGMDWGAFSESRKRFGAVFRWSENCGDDFPMVGKSRVLVVGWIFE